MELSIEAYLYQSNPYRSTTINEPLPYPAETERGPPEAQIPYQQYYGEINDILIKHGFPHYREPAGEDYPHNFKGNFNVVEMSRPGYPGGEDPVTVFYIFFFGGGLPKDFDPARDEVREFLYLLGLDVHVEIAAVPGCRQSLYPISSKDHAVSVYHQAKEQILEVVREKMGQHWEALSLFNMGVSEDKVTPTLVILVKPRMTFDWSGLRLQLLALLNEEKIDVAFHPGGCGFLADSEAGGLDLKKRLTPGSSIGVKGQYVSGTLGGFFELEYGGTTHKGFLTNYHVVADGNAPEQVRMKADMSGSSPDIDNRTQSEIVFYSEEDTRKQLTWKEKILDDITSEIEELVQRRVGLEMTGGHDGRLDQIIDNRNRLIDRYSEEIRVLRLMPKRLGEVFASSGKDIYNGRVSDWAFVKLDSQIPFPQNTMPNYMRENEKFVGLKPGSRVLGFGKIVNDQIYIKVGKTTDVTIGVCNGTRVICNWKSETRYEKRTRVPNFQSEELVIFPRNFNRLHFCQRGDSGSLILDRAAQACGLLWGEMTDSTFENTMGLVTTMTDVVESIKEKRGLLIEPGYT